MNRSESFLELALQLQRVLQTRRCAVVPQATKKILIYNTHEAQEIDFKYMTWTIISITKMKRSKVVFVEEPPRS